MAIDTRVEIYVRKARTPSFRENMFNVQEAQNIPLLQAIQDAIDDGIITTSTTGATTFLELTDTPSTGSLGDIYYHDGTNVVALAQGSTGQVLSAVTSGTPVWTTVSGAVDTNYSISDLTADNDRSHIWSTFDQTENFTTGTFNQSFDAGAGTTTTSSTSTSGLSLTTTDGVNSIGVFNNLVLYQIAASDASDSSQFVVRPGTISMNLVNSSLAINSDSGAIGQVLTSQASGNAPIWADVTPTYTVNRTDIAYTMTGAESLLVVHTTSGLTIDLPSSPNSGDKYTIKQTTTGTIISGNGNTIDGTATYTLPIQNQSITLVFDSTEWVII